MKTKLPKVLAAATAALLLATMRLPAQSAYSNAVASLNPAGYWPMHEVETAAQGDIETNYGSLGPLGEGFYPDWASATPGIKRGAPGILTNDDDRAVSFTRGGSPSANLYTNALYVPHTSPLTTLNPPFTVECWFYPTNLTSEDIWAQSGDVGLNSGQAGANVGSLSGIRLVWLDGSTTGFQIYTLNNGVQDNAGFTGSTGVNTSPSNNWYHLVLTCDPTTNILIYVNDSQAALNPIGGAVVNNPASYAPDYWTPITIGGGRGGTRACAGYIDEFAVYTNVLGTGEIQKHYDDGINSASQTNYFHDVTNDNPVIYLRMNAPAYSPPGIGTWPALMNYGTTNGVAVGNGVYTPGTAPGLVTSSPANPSGVPFGGVSANLVPLSGMSSFGDAGNAAAYNPTGSNANFTISALFRGYPCDGRIQSIVSHGTNSWQLNVITNGHVVFNAGNGNVPAGGTGQAAGDVSTIGVYNDGNWHQVVAVNQTNEVFIYVDGVLDTNGTPANISVTNLINGNSDDVMIGSDPTYTNIPVGAGRQFAGQICDVAFWTNALTAGEVQTLYNNCEAAPFITAQPLANTALNGGPGTYTNFQVTAKGSGALNYQWYFNTTSNYSGATKLVDNGHYVNSATPQVTVTNLTGNDNGYYYAVIQNTYGSATSILANLTIYAAPTITNQAPATDTNLFTLFAGVNPVFSIAAVGAQPIHYFWYTNGVVDAAATNANFTWSNVAAGTITNYCILTNIAGSATSMVWTASVIADPTAPYPAAVLSNGPMGYWRLNEPDDGNGASDGNDGAVCHDYARGNDGIYTNMVLGLPGYSSTTDPTETAAWVGENNISFYDSMAEQIEGVDFAATNGANGEFTVEAWANGYNGGQLVGAPLMAKGLYGIDDQFNLGIDSSKTHYEFYVRAANGTAYTVGSGSSPALDGNWHHIVGVCDEANGQLLLYYDGKLVNVEAIPANSGVYEDPEPITIGAGSTDGVNYTNQFYGYMNDVAIYNRPLNISQVMAQYSAAVPGGVAPYFVQAPPTTALVNEGNTLVLPVVAAGTTPIGYYWTDVNANTNLAMVATNGLPLNATLTASNVPAAWNGDQLELTVTNAVGSTNVYVTLVVNTNAPKLALTLNLPSPVTVLSGRSYVYSIGAAGPTPYSYQWYNAGNPVGGAINATYTVTAGSAGSTTYYVVVTNYLGAVTSTVSTFISINPPPAPAFAYATNILALNPAGYWPMHETEAAAQGDIEVNYGSLGPLGEGFYPDWAGNYGAFVRGVPGALTNDSDTALNFTRGGASGADTPAESYTNDVFIPNASPLATLVPPFTVECWFYPTNVNSQDIWDQNDDEGLNQGGAGGNAGNLAGIRLVWLNGTTTGFEIYTLANGVQSNVGFTGTSGGNASPLDNWYHLVVTCDANTNISIYTNGFLAALNNIGGTPVNNPASYSPNYWSPITIGGGRGGTRAVAGYIDEFAVYTNVIGTNSILEHYYDAIGGNPGQYFTDVRNLNPVIYLRMDASNYLEPATNFWPVLFNYGNAGANGVYMPGAAPGLLPGPSTNAGGASFNGLSGKVTMFSGVGTFADAGYAPAFNPTGSNADFSVMAWFRGNPCDNRIQAIAGHGTNSWQLSVTTNGCVVFDAGNGNHAAGGTGQAVGDISTVGVYNDGNWHQVVAVNQANFISIYVDGLLDTSGMPSGITPASVIPGNADDVIIGSDPIYTNYPTGAGASFAGQICDVAFLTNALNAGEVSALYAAALNPAQIPAYVAPEPPLNVTAASGGSLSLTAGAAGTSAVGYLWQINTNGGGSAVLQSGAGNSPLAANLTVPSVSAAWNAGQLELTVTNAYGTNSAFVTLSVVAPSVNPNPTNIVFAVTNNNLYLSWPADHTGWQLQAQTNSLAVGISTNWVNISGSTATNQSVIPINLTNGSVFYRLTY